MDKPATVASPPPSGTADKAANASQRDRVKREADALRANLRKRKDQARIRAETAERPKQD